MFQNQYFVLVGLFLGLEGILGAPGSSRRPHGPKISKTFRKTSNFVHFGHHFWQSLGTTFRRYSTPFSECFFGKPLKALLLATYEA